MCACVGSCVRVWCAVGVMCGGVVWWFVSVATRSLKPRKFYFAACLVGQTQGRTGGGVDAVVARPHGVGAVVARPHGW